MSLRRFLLVALLSTFPAIASAQTSAAERLLAASARAHQRVRTVAYHARVTIASPRGNLQSYEGDVRVQRIGGKGFPRVRIYATTTDRSTGVREIFVYSDSALHITRDGGIVVAAPRIINRSRLVDPVDSAVQIRNSPLGTVLVARDSNAAKLLRQNPIYSMVNTPFISERPFDMVPVRTGDARYEGLDTVDGVPCHVVAVPTLETGIVVEETQFFYIGVRDTLLRRIVLERDEQGETVRHTIELAELRAGIDLGADAFAVRIPDGYSVEEYGYVKRFEPIAAQQRAPGWKLSNGAGDSISLSDFAGKLVLVEFWGTWCAPAVAAMPSLERLYRKYRNRSFVVVGISCGESSSRAPVEFMQQNNLTWPLALDGDELMDLYSVRSFPSTYLVGTDGRIVFSSAGAWSEEELEKLIVRYLTDKGM